MAPPSILPGFLPEDRDHGLPEWLHASLQPPEHGPRPHRAQREFHHPADEVAGCARSFRERGCERAHLPPVLIEGETGTGKHVARAAAEDLKHVTLELGGSDAAIVCDDADLDVAARTVAIGRFFNAGQACLAIKRVFVFDSVADEFIDRISARAMRQALERRGVPADEVDVINPHGTSTPVGTIAK